MRRVAARGPDEDEVLTVERVSLDHIPPRIGSGEIHRSLGSVCALALSLARLDT